MSASTAITSWRDRMAWWLFRHLAQSDTASTAWLHYRLKMAAESVVYTMPNGSTSGFYKPQESFAERVERRYNEMHFNDCGVAGGFPHLASDCGESLADNGSSSEGQQ